MSRIYKSCIKCGYLYDYNAYIFCPECGSEQVIIKEKVEIVRCKDCMGILPEGRKKHKCEIYRMFGNDNFYCALGKLQDVNKAEKK